MQYASVAQSQPEYASKVRKSPDLLISTPSYQLKNTFEPQLAKLVKLLYFKTQSSTIYPLSVLALCFFENEDSRYIFLFVWRGENTWNYCIEFSRES